MYFNDILENTPEELIGDFTNNFIDIMIEPNMSLKAPLNILTDELECARKITFHPYDPDKSTGLSAQMYDSEGKQFNVTDFIKEYVESMEYDDATRVKLISSLNKLYQRTINEDQKN